MISMVKSLFCGVCIITLPMSVSAQVSTLKSHFIPMDKEVVLSSLVEGDSLYVPVQSGRSYCCEMWGEATNTTYPGSLRGIEGPALKNPANRGHSAPGLNSAYESVRVCFLSDPLNSNTQTSAQLFVMASAEGDNSVECNETTLFGSYNTIATDFNFLELTNTLSGNVSKNRLFVEIQGEGTIAGRRLFTRTLEIEAGKRVDIDLHSIVGREFGPVVIRHNGPKGALRAHTGQYKLRSTQPLNFEPVSVIEFRERQ